MGTLAVLHSLYAIKTMISSCQCVSCLDLVCIMDLRYIMSKIHFQNIGILYVKYLTQIFCVCMFVLCCPGGAVLGLGT